VLHSIDITAESQNCWDDSSNNMCQWVYGWTDQNASAAETADWLVAKPLAILGLLVLGWFLRLVLRRLIDRITNQAAEGTVPGVLQRGKAGALIANAENNSVAIQRREQRARSMGSLLKSISTTVLVVIIGFMAISQLGYDIAPLIASAGIIGVALGFGAQSLVKDYLAGIFMILEDQYGVGDVVDLGEESNGTVEAVGLRVTRVRDVNGTVWYARNGEILRVGNKSQNWAQAVLDIPVSYDADLAQVRDVLGEIAHEMWEAADYRDLIIEEPSVWGVERLDRDAVIVRVVLKTAPMEQWNIAREMRERIIERFDDLGIAIPSTAGFSANRDGPGSDLRREP